MPSTITVADQSVVIVDVDTPNAVSGRQCPVCRSWETSRHVEGFRIWFTCDRCHAVFS